MNTPAHVAASLLVWRNETSRHAAWAVTLGAGLPDAPMYAFYVVQKLLGTAEREIWSTEYYRDSWQLFFDIFNSIPLALLLIAVGIRTKNRFLQLAAQSSLLDLPVHHDDGHRHFLPFSHWRFASPVSYWDPDHHGREFMVLELFAAVFACLWVCRRSPDTSMRRMAIANLGLYALGLTIVGLVVLRGGT
ncbi:MAG: hypothetical protein NXI04_27140 [Planctomycetaceae bacterium]|nr:hypothetical protein [Planctomycetaceae bacterium]